jgi:hypothetical protein
MPWCGSSGKLFGGSDLHRTQGGLHPNYGERWHYGEWISPAFVESVVNQVVSKGIVKQQHMRWSSSAAHLLLQVGTQVLNEDPHATFGRWDPMFATGPRELGAIIGCVSSPTFPQWPRLAHQPASPV